MGGARRIGRRRVGGLIGAGNGGDPAQVLAELRKCGVIQEPGVVTVRGGGQYRGSGDDWSALIDKGILADAPLIGEGAAVGGLRFHHQRFRRCIQLVGGVLGVTQNIGVVRIRPHRGVHLYGQHIGLSAHNHLDFIGHGVEVHPPAAAGGQDCAVDGDVATAGSVGRDQRARDGHVRQGVFIGTGFLVVSEAAHAHRQSVKNEGILAAGGVHRHAASAPGEGHGDGVPGLAGQRHIGEVHLFQLQQIVVCAEEGGQQLFHLGGLEAVVFQDHVGGGVAAAVGPLLHAEGHLFPGTGQGAGHQDLGLIVGTVVLGQADDLALAADSAFRPGFRIEAHAALRHFLLFELAGDVAAQIKGQFHRQAALVDALEGLVARDGEDISAELHAVLGCTGHTGGLGVDVIQIEGQLDCAALAGQDSARGVIEGEGDGALSCLLLLHFHPGDADVGIVQIDGAALMQGVARCHGIADVFHHIAHVVINRQCGALIGQEAPGVGGGRAAA